MKKKRITVSVPEGPTNIRVMNSTTGEILECSHLAPLTEHISRAIEANHRLIIEAHDPREPFALPAGARWAGDNRKAYEFKHHMDADWWRMVKATTIYCGMSFTPVVYCETEVIADRVIEMHENWLVRSKVDSVTASRLEREKAEAKGNRSA